MQTTFFTLSGIALFAFGCGGSGSSASAGAGGGTSSTTGAGGAAATTSSSTTGAGGGTAASCNHGAIQLNVDGKMWQLTKPCYGKWPASVGSEHPSAYLGHLITGGPEVLFVEGCGNNDPKSGPLFHFDVPLQGVGMATTGDASYTSLPGMPSYTTSTDVTANVTDFGPVGDFVNGTFSIKVTGGTPPQTKMLTGNFQACHVPDKPTP
jgi:hypothetical protein